MTRKETLRLFKGWVQRTLGNNCSDENYQMATNIIALLEQDPNEEFEKIMIEVGNIEQTKTYIGNIVFKNPQEIKDEVMELLDNYISELKGENNAE